MKISSKMRILLVELSMDSSYQLRLTPTAEMHFGHANRVCLVCTVTRTSKDSNSAVQIGEANQPPSDRHQRRSASVRADPGSTRGRGRRARGRRARGRPTRGGGARGRHGPLLLELQGPSAEREGVDGGDHGYGEDGAAPRRGRRQPRLAWPCGLVCLRGER